MRRAVFSEPGHHGIELLLPACRGIMDAITFFIAVLLSIFTFVCTPIKAFIILCSAIVWYPDFLTIKLGVIDFTVPRILIIVLYANLFLRTNKLESFRFMYIDAFVILAFIGKFTALLANVPASRVLENQGGYFFDTVLIYFLTRLIITSKDYFLRVLKSLLMISVPLAILGIIDSFTGFNIFHNLQQYSDWVFNPNRNIRNGFFRATGSFRVHILFGLYFASLYILAFALWHDREWSRGRLIGVIVCMLIGMLSSMSSAPIFAVILGSAILVAYPLRHYATVLLAIVIAVCLFAEVLSNRHFYEIPIRFAFSGSTAYYRIGLINEAFGGGMDGHWLFGYGMVGMGNGNDNSNFHWKHKDLVNIYIEKLATTGLCGLLPYIMLNIAYYLALYKAGKRALPLDRWLVWSVASTMIAWNIVMMTVSAFAKIDTFLYIYIAICANLPAIMTTQTVYVLNRIKPEQQSFPMVSPEVCK
jgi:hypothetical protein